MWNIFAPLPHPLQCTMKHSYTVESYLFVLNNYMWIICVPQNIYRPIPVVSCETFSNSWPIGLQCFMWNISPCAVPTTFSPYYCFTWNIWALLTSLIALFCVSCEAIWRTFPSACPCIRGKQCPHLLPSPFDSCTFQGSALHCSDFSSIADCFMWNNLSWLDP